MLTHQPFDPLMIGNDALVLQGSPDPAPAISFELVRYRGDCDQQFCVIEPLSRVAIVGRSRNAYQLTSSRDGHAEGPVTTDVIPLLGREALRRATLRKSNSSACLPTRRSRAAIRASLLLDKVCRAGVIVERAAFVLLDPDADQLTGNIETLGQTMQRLAAEVVLDDLPPKLQTM